MQIQHKTGDGRGMFYMEEESSVVGELVYAMNGTSQMIIEHTGVDEELRGNKLGYELVKSSVAYAREHRLKIVPVCPFAKAVFEQEPDFKDVWLK